MIFIVVAVFVAACVSINTGFGVDKRVWLTEV